MAGPVHPLIEILAAPNGFSDCVRLAKGHGRQQRESGPVRKQIARDVCVRRVLEADGPADGIELMARAGANGVRPVFDEELDDRQLSSFGGEMDWIRLIALIANVRIGAALEEQAHDGLVVDAEMKCRSQAGIVERSSFVDQGGMSVEDPCDFLCVTASGRLKKRRQCRICGPASFDRSRQRDPALMSAFACECVLHVAQDRVFRGVWIRAAEPLLRCGIAAAKGLQPALGFLLEVVEGTHATPSFR
jgi:hypothetical protein